MRTYDEIKAAVLAKGYKWFEGNLNLNWIWERTSDEVTNHFTDQLYLVYQDENGTGQVLNIPATTKPGLIGAIDTPITYEGVTGTAVIIPGQYPGSHQFHDTYSEFSNYPYLRQIKGLQYWRDGNKDLIIDHVQEQDNKIFGTHVHRMSQNGTYGSGQVNNWSEGCMGAPEPEFVKLLPIIRASISVYGNTFTQTLMESVDFAPVA